MSIIAAIHLFSGGPMSPANKTTSSYSVHPGVAQIQKWVSELPQKTGRSLEEWMALTRKSGPATEKERREWLKKEHKFGTNSAMWIAGRLAGKNTEEDSPEAYLKTAEEWVEAQYAGVRAALRPLYEQLLKLGFSLGKDVKACPCKTMVPFYRKHVFAQIKPSTNTRIDLGFALGNMKTPKRLIDTGGFEKKDRITRRIEIKSKEEIDDEVKGWLTKAYEMDE
jgi:predicted transport protein